MADFFIRISSRPRYDVALLYLQQASYDLNTAVEAHLADVKWEEEHPIAGSNGKHTQRPGRRKFGVGTGLSSQI